jgi:hypothetical protein
MPLRFVASLLLVSLGASLGWGAADSKLMVALLPKSKPEPVVDWLDPRFHRGF